MSAESRKKPPCYGFFHNNEDLDCVVCNCEKECCEEEENHKMDGDNTNKVSDAGKKEMCVKERVVGNPVILVTGLGKKYYELKYTSAEDNQVYVGYGSKDINIVLNYLEECFEIVDDKKEEDVVAKPNHYRQGLYEVLDEMLIVFGPEKTYDFCILNSWKYRARAPFKGKLEQDMDKANRYMEYAHDIQEAYPHVFGPIPLVRKAKEAVGDDGLNK